MKALDAVGQAQQLQRANPEPVQIDLVPTQTMTRGRRMSVMVVVPALTKRQQRYPPTVTRVVAGFDFCSAPQMSGRIDEPRRVECQCYPEENSPQQYPPASKNEKHHSN